MQSKKPTIQDLVKKVKQSTQVIKEDITPTPVRLSNDKLDEIMGVFDPPKPSITLRDSTAPLAIRCGLGNASEYQINIFEAFEQNISAIVNAAKPRNMIVNS